MNPPDTPEHEKLLKVKAELGTEHIGAFLEWLGHEGIQLAKFWRHEVNCEGGSHHKKEHCGYEADGVLYCIHESIQALLARYADIDLQKLEDEKRAILEYQRALNEHPRGA